MQKTNNAPTAHELRVFSLIVAIGFSVLGWVIPTLRGKDIHVPLLLVSGLVFVFGMATPKLMVKPREIWIKIGNVLGKINSTIIFTVIYFTVFAGVGLIFRIIKRDRLFTRFKSVKSTLVMKNEISPFTDPF